MVKIYWKGIYQTLKCATLKQGNNYKAVTYMTDYQKIMRKATEGNGKLIELMYVPVSK